MASVQTASHADVDRQVAVAAAEGDAARVVELLAVHKILDVHVRMVQGRYRALDEQDAMDVVADAVEQYMVRVRRGDQIRSVRSWLGSTALNLAFDLHHLRAELEVPGHEPDEAAEDGPDQPYDGPDHDATVTALRAVRGLIPRAGRQNVQDVLHALFDAAEAGLDDVNATDIGRQLGLNPATVRTCKRRGLQRLENLARDEGLVDDYLDAAGLVPPDSDGPHDPELGYPTETDREQAIQEAQP